ncbi:hypothetical protein FM120_15595 [Sphingobacterium faecium PCAi_F2.5]|nr:hypothetical protein FM120_15595 [Sphingobacterium faecium PCAi_F2.5]
MVQKWSLIKMALVGFSQKTLVFLCQIGSIAFFDVPILFVDDRKIRQGLDSLMPGGVNSFVFRRCYRKQFRQTNLKAGGNVRIFGKDAVVFYCQQRKFVFQRCCLCNVSHRAFDLGVNFK